MQHLYDTAPWAFTAIFLLIVIGTILLMTILIQRRLPKCNKCGKQFRNWPSINEYYVHCSNHDCNNVLFYDGNQTEDDSF